MFSLTARFLLHTTSTAPFLIIYSWTAFMTLNNFAGFMLLGLFSLLVFMCYILLNYARNHFPVNKISLQKVEFFGSDYSLLFIIYTIPILSFQYDLLNWYIWLPALLLITAMIHTSNAFSCNLLLTVLGWDYYKFKDINERTYILITKKECKFITGKAVQLTERIYMEI